MTGREAVIYFMKCRHLRKAECAYLVHVCENEYRPYDLLTVRQHEIKACQIATVMVMAF